jgi:CheY-like chemotaxis protein
MGDVLVVEDDAGTRDLLRTILEEAGYGVRTAHDGAEALERIREAPPAVILLDLFMPVLNGWAFLAAYEHTPAPRARVAVMSVDVDAARKAPADAWLEKPFGVSDLLNVVRSLAGAPSPVGDPGPGTRNN